MIEEISLKKFKELYYSKTDQEIALLLGISRGTVKNYCLKFGIKPKGKGYFKKRYSKVKLVNN